MSYFLGLFGGLETKQLTRLVTFTLYSKHKPALEATGGPYSVVTTSSHSTVQLASSVLCKLPISPPSLSLTILPFLSSKGPPKL